MSEWLTICFQFINISITLPEREFRRRGREGHLGRAAGQREVCVEHLRRRRGQGRSLPQRSQPSYEEFRSKISLIHIFAAPPESSGLRKGALQLECNTSGIFPLYFITLDNIQLLHKTIKIPCYGVKYCLLVIPWGHSSKILHFSTDIRPRPSPMWHLVTSPTPASRIIWMDPFRVSEATQKIRNTERKWAGVKVPLLKTPAIECCLS